MFGLHTSTGKEKGVGKKTGGKGQSEIPGDADVQLGQGTVTRDGFRPRPRPQRGDLHCEPRDLLEPRVPQHVRQQHRTAVGHGPGPEGHRAEGGVLLHEVGEGRDAGRKASEWDKIPANAFNFEYQLFDDM